MRSAASAACACCMRPRQRTNIGSMPSTSATGNYLHSATGDDVILLKLDGMQEQARTKTDPQGVFTFNETDAKTVYVVRVFHQKVGYDQNVTGVNPLEVKVFDAVPKIAGLSGNIGMAQIEPDKTTLKVTEMYSITNASSPPVTQAGRPKVEV